MAVVVILFLFVATIPIITMAYFTRIFGVQDPNIAVAQLVEALQQKGLKAQFGIDPSEEFDSWTILEVGNAAGVLLAQIERNPVVEGEFGKEELDEFMTELDGDLPKSAAKWLKESLKNTKVIYAFQLMAAANDDNGFDILAAIRQSIHASTGGVLQADGEGFFNENGDLIIWHFGEKVAGKLACAVLDGADIWVRFEMELGDPVQRKQFCNGQVPWQATRL